MLDTGLRTTLCEALQQSKLPQHGTECTSVNTTVNLYCDESCHLENDHQKAMVLGVLSAPDAEHRQLADELKAILRSYGVHGGMEAKWATASPSKLPMYLEVVDWFFDSPALRFRAFVVPDKSILDHGKFGQSHDDFYYKAWYHAIVPLLSRLQTFNIYIDKKDTRSSAKARKLAEVLGNKMLDFDGRIVQRIQHVHSHEVPLMQLLDLLTGAISYVHRGLKSSQAKLAIIERIRQRSQLSLDRTTLLREEKLNILVWHPGGA
jgi:hypothetical protein